MGKNKIRISNIYGNSGLPFEAYVNLPVGFKLKAKKDKLSKDDIGFSGLTFDYVAFKKDEIYTVHSTTRWTFQEVGYVQDESGTLHLATPDLFELID